MMTDSQKANIARLQKLGLGYRKIASELGLTTDAVKSYCVRHPVEPELDVCPQCGVPLKQKPHRKRQKFCSDVCRFAWWNRNREKAKVSTRYTATCANCGQSFESEKKGRVYCSRQCYADARRRAVSDG